MKHPKHLWRELVTEIAAFSLLAASIMLLWRHNLPLFIVLLAEALAALSLWHDRHDVICFVVIAVMGSLAEVAFVHFGVWRYANPTLLGLPLWFPVGFGTAFLIGQRLARTITGMWEEMKPPRALTDRENQDNITSGRVFPS